MRLAQPLISLGDDGTVEGQEAQSELEEVGGADDKCLQGDQRHRASVGWWATVGLSRVLDPLPVCQMAEQQMQLCCCSFVPYVTPCHSMEAEARKFLHCFCLVSLTL